MFQSISLENLAFYLSRFIYRDTKIESYHRNNVLLGMGLYDEMIVIVDENVKKVQRYHAKMTSIQTEKEADDQLRRMSFSKRNTFIEYVISFNHLSKCKCNWDPPQKIDPFSPPKNLSKFILDGHFIECCKKQCLLSDSIMCYINKDIYNRIYTLVCENLLP